jgi:hypothetical protein
MSYGRGDQNYLFRDGDMFATIEEQKQQVKSWVDHLDANLITNSSIEDLCTYVENEFRLDTPELHDEQAHVDQREAEVEVRDSFLYGHFDESRPLRLSGTLVELVVPFTGDGNLFRLRPNTFSSMPPRGIVQNGHLVLQVSGVQLEQAQVSNELKSQIADIKKYLDWQRADTKPFNTGLRELARGHIERRKQKLLNDRNLVAGLGFAMKKRPDSSATYTAPVARKRIVPKLPVAGIAPYKPEPVLDEGEYQNILDIMMNMALVMERSPSAFTTIDEEDLRQHFLVQLNGQYEGQATGETFNYQGKTDILVRADGKNIFVAECKYWRGEKSYADTIDQILSYLSWRDTKAALVIFNRNKGFTDVLEKIKTATAAHWLCKSGPKIQSETRLRYIFGQKDDPNREVILTILAFDVPPSNVT